MRYDHIYHRLIQRARMRRLDGYCERHHVVPRCLGGDEGPDNLVRLTPEEHYVAHQLLVKMHPGNMRLVWAAVAMTNGTTKRPRRNKLYGWLRRQLATRLSEKFSGHQTSPEAREKMRAAKLGKKRRPHSEETRTKMSVASKGRMKSPAHCAAMSAAKVGKMRGPHSDQHKQRLSASIRLALTKRDLVADRNDPIYRSLQAERMRGVWERRRSGALPYPSHLSPLGG